MIAADHFVKEHEYVPTLITGGVPAVKDLATKVRLLLKELGFKGTARIATYGEREYIILSGYAGLRKILTGTRYELKNAKIVEMGLGKLNAARSVAEVSRLSVFLVLGVDVVQYYLLDKQTPAEVGWDISTDLLKGVGASFVGAAAAVGAGALTSVAVVPLATGVVVTFVAGVALDHFFPTSTIAQAMSKHFSDAVESSEHYIEHLEHQFLP